MPSTMPMIFSYSGDPGSSDTDQLRFLVQDTDPGMPLLTDTEYAWLIAEWMPRYDSLIYVAAIAAGIISRKFIGIVSVSADGVSVNTSDLSDRYSKLKVALTDEYKAHQQTGVEIDLGNIMFSTGFDYSIRPLRFAVALHDNIEAGQQDYGGWLVQGIDDIISPGPIPRESTDS